MVQFSLKEIRFRKQEIAPNEDIVLLQENPHKGLQTVSKQEANKTTLPVLNNILISTDGVWLKLTATSTWYHQLDTGRQGGGKKPSRCRAKLLADFQKPSPASMST